MLEVAAEVNDIHGDLHDRSIDLAKARNLRAGDVEKDPQAVVAALMEEIAELRARLERVEQQHRHDSLTGVLSREAFLDSLRREWNLHAQSDLPLGVLFFDIDYFKEVNDKYDHMTGDAVLAAVGAQSLRCMRRAGELVGRFGGDEFVVLLPRASDIDAASAAERIRRAIGAMKLPVGGETLSISISIGAASVHPNKEARGCESLLTYADHALLASKQGGRNRTVVRRDGDDVETRFANVTPLSRVPKGGRSA
jgi:diguanylate cyclase (GGDEF)-like protein